MNPRAAADDASHTGRRLARAGAAALISRVALLGPNGPRGGGRQVRMGSVVAA